MNDSQLFLLCMYVCTFEIIVTLLGDLKKECEGWPMMVRPVIAGDSASEISFRVICRPLRCVDQEVLISMFLV